TTGRLAPPVDVDSVAETQLVALVAAITSHGSVVATDLLFFFKQKTAYEVGLGIPAEPLFRSKDCVTIDVLPRTPGNNVYVGFMVWSNFTATKCRGLVSLNQVIKEIICLQPLK